MSEDIVVSKNLVKRYKGINVVDSVSIKVKKGHIYGLVGRNGAGKTTVLKMIVGNTVQTSGEIELFGKSDAKGIEIGRSRSGAIIENPAFFPYLTAKENLEYYRIQRGIAENNIDEILMEVGLGEVGKKKFKNFSLGMKQRLGLALAISSNPDILILDEPINGLDPMGIVEFRNIILKLNKDRGITVLISSHILNELANIATDFGFIEKGKIIQEISAVDLHEKCKECLQANVSSTEKVATLLEQKLNCRDYEVISNTLINIYNFNNEPSIISELIVKNGVKLNSMVSKGQNLEDYFIALVGGKENA